ncbi:MAG: RDD family protein [Thermodesulfovibrionia bacterium]
MDSQETLNAQQDLKANILNRIIARCIDILIAVAFLELLSKTGYFAGLLYILIADGLLGGRSVGKWLIGLKVIVVETGAPCTYKESIIRNIPIAIGYILFGLLKNIPLIGWLLGGAVFVIILGIEGLIMIGSQKGMRLGDEIARTQVIEATIGGD